MELQECFMISTSVFKEGDKLPVAMVITMAPSREEAEMQAKKELADFISGQDDKTLKTKDIGSILYPAIPTTIFLYTRNAGRIK